MGRSAPLALVIICLIVVETNGSIQVTRPPASRLLQTLRDNYGPTTVRPVYNTSRTTRVAIRIFVTQIIELNEREQFVQISGLMRLKWQDEFLKWNTSEYPGVQRLYMSANDIWTPDITMYTNVDEFFERTKNIPSIVTPDGTVEWNFPAILKSSCQIDTLLFPFDIQRCELVFASWVFTIIDIDLYKDTEQKQNLSAYFVPNGVWELTEVNVVVEEIDYPCCPDPFAQVIFSLYLTRRPLYYILSIILPAILLAVISLSVYMLPPDSGEKISLGVTTLLALLLFQELIGGSLPPSSDKTPIISYFFTPMVVIGCTSIICSVVILNLHHRGSYRPVPRWLRQLTFRFMGPILCYRRSAETMYSFDQMNGPTRSSTMVESWPRMSSYNIRDSPNHDGAATSSSDQQQAQRLNINAMGGEASQTADNIQMNSFCDLSNEQCSADQCCRHHEKCVGEVLRTVEKMYEATSRARANRDEPVPEWQEVALVLDRFMLLVSAVTMLASITMTMIMFITKSRTS